MRRNRMRLTDFPANALHRFSGFATAARRPIPVLTLHARHRNESDRPQRRSGLAREGVGDDSLVAHQAPDGDSSGVKKRAGVSRSVGAFAGEVEHGLRVKLLRVRAGGDQYADELPVYVRGDGELTPPLRLTVSVVEFDKGVRVAEGNRACKQRHWSAECNA